MNNEEAGRKPLMLSQLWGIRGRFLRAPLKVRIVVTVSTIMASVSLMTSAVTAVFMIPVSNSLAINLARTKVLSLAKLSKIMIDPSETITIRTRKDENSQSYLRIHRQLDRLAKSVTGVGYAYVWRLKKEPGSKRGFRVFWVINNMPLRSKMFKPVGAEYPLISHGDEGLDELFTTGKAAADKNFYTDYAGTWISGYAPIHIDSSTGDVDVVVIDISADYIVSKREAISSQLLFATLASALLMIPFGIGIGWWMCLPLKRIVQHLKKLSSLDIAAIDSPIPANWIYEINQVSDALERMTAALSSFALYLPRDVVKKLLAANEMARKGGTVKQVVIMFTDIRNFTSYSERTHLDVLLPKLNQYFTDVSLQISKQCGTIDKFIGDSVMAFWGAPSHVEQPAFHACQAALAIRRVCDAMNQQWREEGLDLDFTTRIGIHIGAAIVGNFGSDERINYTAIGDTVNLASRLESTNKQYDTDIIVSRSIVDAVIAETGKESFDFDRIDTIHVRGKSQKVEIYALRGPSHSAALSC